MDRQVKADLLLVLVAFFWGISYLLMKIALADLQEFNMIALRFIIGFIFSVPVFYKNILKANLKTIQASFLLAIILFCVYISVSYGVKYTTTSNAGFLASLAVVLVPIFSAVIFKSKPERKAIIGVCFALIGIGLLTLNERLTMNIGDLLCTLCAIFYSFHLIATDKLTKEVDSVALGIMQLGFVALFSTVFSFIMETPKLPSSTESWISIIFLSICCTGAAFIIQTIAQQYTTPTHVGLIFSLEPVFAAMVGSWFLGEILSMKGYLGAFLMLIGILIAEIDIQQLIHKNNMEEMDKQH